MKLVSRGPAPRKSTLRHTRVQKCSRCRDAHNRQVDQHNKKVEADYNRQVDKVNAHNSAVIADLNRQLRASSSGPRYTVDEQALADRIQHAVAQRDDREWDTFLSYVRIDGAEIGDALRRHLESLGVSVWFDEIAIAPGKSQALLNGWAHDEGRRAWP